MVSAILNVAMGMMGVFAFLVFLTLLFRIIDYFGFYLLLNRLIAELCKWIKSKFD